MTAYVLGFIFQIHGVIFVIDSSAADRLQECKKELVNLLAHKRISGKPVLMWVTASKDIFY